MTSADGNNSDEEHGGRRLGAGRIAIVAGAVIAASALTAGVALAVNNRSAPATKSLTAIKTPPPPKPAPVAARPKPAPIVPLKVRSISPSLAATGVRTNSLISIAFTVPPTVTSPAPTLDPPVAGRWARRGLRWVFHPLGGYVPTTKETVTVAASTAAREGRRRVPLRTAFHSSFTVGPVSILRLQQLLAELHYLPFTFTRTVASPATTTTTSTTVTSTTSTTAAGSRSTTVPGLSVEPSVADAVSTTPRPGQLTWAYANIPASLAAEWTEGKADEVTLGAVMAFEADHGLGVDGDAGPEVWTALAGAVAARQVDPRPYNYIEVTENSPESLTVWQDGDNDVYSSPANTGAPGAATELGTFPVYLRYTSHAMIGTNPDGTKYDDPDIQWIAYFNGGDAVHGYPRAEYGFPQSNGCVELPIPNAGAVFNSGEDWYGTLVNVT